VDRRTLLAFFLCSIIAFVWIWRVQTAQRERMRRAAEQAAQEEQKPAPAPAPEQVEPSPPPAEVKPALAPASEPEPPLREAIPLRGEDLKYELVFTNRGASLREARLTEFPEALGSTEGVLLLKGVDDGPGCTLAIRDQTGELPLDSRVYSVVEEEPGRLVFAATFQGGLRVVKEFTGRPGKYEMGVRVTLQNRGSAPLTVRYRILAAARVVPESGYVNALQGMIGSLYENGRVRVEKQKPSRARKKPLSRMSRPEEPVIWAGAANRYFAAVLRPDPPKGRTLYDMVRGASIEYLEKTDQIVGTSGRSKRIDNVAALLTAQPLDLQPGESVTHRYVYFLGPKKQEVLAAYPDMAKLLDYGLFGSISKLLLGLLHVFHRLVPNYGVGIILLTIAVRLCLHPLTRKSQVSMHKMQKLQPLIREIQEKYKGDKQRQSREQMELFRKHGANPMSGCLPLFFQFPVFFGLFRMLQYSVDLRQEGFMLWIKDLSRPDTIGHLGGFPINILPVLMVISWVVQQLTMPKPADPQQRQSQKMMLLMPIFFGFLLYGMASGLTLYWLTSTALGIVEQKLIKWQIQKKEERGEFAPVQAQARGGRPRHGRSRRR